MMDKQIDQYLEQGLVNLKKYALAKMEKDMDKVLTDFNELAKFIKDSEYELATLRQQLAEAKPEISTGHPTN